MSENFCVNKFEIYDLILGILRDVGTASTVVPGPRLILGLICLNSYYINLILSNL